DENDHDAPTASDAKVDQILAGMKGTNMPDILKAKASDSKGEKFAAYQGSTALKKGSDTQRVEPAVVIDQTQQESISASEVHKAAADNRAKLSREATTAVIELGGIPKKKSVVPLVTFVVVFAIGLAVVVAKMQGPAVEADAIPPASAAAIAPHVSEPQIPPAPSAVAMPAVTTPTVTTPTVTTTEATVAVTPAPTNVAPVATPSRTSPARSSSIPASSPSAHATASASSRPAPATTSSADNDPDRALFKTNRTP
ncbi:MAG: hypothetical protein ABI551_08525, partial [Polyangiaceae bacterium]